MLKDIINQLANDKVVYADVIDVGNGQASVKLVGSDSRLSNLDIIGSQVITAGDRVLILWDGKKPYIHAGKNVDSPSSTSPTGVEDGALEEEYEQYLEGYNSDDLVEELSGIADAYADLVAKGYVGSGETIWHSGNDGTGSGLDADLLDGLQGASYLKVSGDAIEGLTTADNLYIDPSHANYRLWIGNADPASAGFGLYKTGGMRAVAGDIGGMTITENTIYLEDEVYLGAQDEWRLWVGHEDPDSAPFRVNNAGEVWLDDAHIAATLQSSNYQSGLQGWKLDLTGWAEFEDVTIRGVLSNVVFEYEPIHIMTGRIRVADSATLTRDLAPYETMMYVSDSTLQVYDILQWKADESRKEWMQVIGGPWVESEGYSYEIERYIGGGSAQQFYSGESCAVTGQANYPAASMFGESDFGRHEAFAGNPYSALGGFLTIDGSRTYGPYFGVARRYGAAYNQLWDVARFGLLRGFLGETEDIYGIAIGDTDRHFIYSYEYGLEIVTRAGMTSVDANGLRTDSFAIWEDTDAPDYVDGAVVLWMDETNKLLKALYKHGATESTVTIADFN